MIRATSMRGPDDAADGATAPRASGDSARCSKLEWLAKLSSGRGVAAGPDCGIRANHQPAKAIAQMMAPPDAVTGAHTPDLMIISPPANRSPAQE
jgi:hypothetical protein